MSGAPLLRPRTPAPAPPAVATGASTAAGRPGRHEESELVARAARGDREALGTLLALHRPLAIHVARAHLGHGLSLDDLVGEACVGIIEATSRFDATRGFRFITYAVWWMKRRVVEAMSAQASNVRVPRHRYAAERAAGCTPVREVSLSEVAEPVAQDADLDACVFGADRTRALRCALDALPERDRRVLERRHGLPDGHECTLDVLALELGVSKERVRQLEARALCRLREALCRWA